MSKMLQPRLSLILESDSKVKRMRKKRVKFVSVKLVHVLQNFKNALILMFVIYSCQKIE